MNSKSYVAVVIALTILISPVLLSAGHPFLTYASETRNSQSPDNGPQVPLMFIENVGQFDPRVRFQMRGASEMMWLAEDAIWITVIGRQVDKAEEANCEVSLVYLSTCLPASARGVNIRLTFPGANPHPRLEPFDRLDTTVSYFTGSDASRWRADVPVWGGVRYVDLYPGVDLEITALNGRWTWQVTEREPRSPIEHPMLHVEGADEVALEANHLRLQSGNEQVILPLLAVDGVPTASPSIAKVGEAVFDVLSPLMSSTANTAAPNRRIPVDNPNDLVYSTFLGGVLYEAGEAVAVDPSGHAYVTGITPSADFPTTPGVIDPSLGGLADAFVAKLNPSGTGLVYATFLGGSAGDNANALDVDDLGYAFVVGRTFSADFPTTVDAFDSTLGGEADAFVAILSPSGTALVYATFLGGSEYDAAGGIALRSPSGISITGTTDSPDFPTTSGAFDAECGTDGACNFNGSFSYPDAFVVAMTPGSPVLNYSTFIGGQDGDGSSAIAVGNSGAVFIAGNTYSQDFPVTPGAFDTTYNDLVGLNDWGDVFVASLDSSGSSLAFATYLGGGLEDIVTDLALDDSNNVYTIGQTDSGDFPTTPGSFDPGFNGGTVEYCCDAFVTKLSADGATLIFGTFLGGYGWDEGHGIAVDAFGAVYATGVTNSPNFPTTPNAYDTSYNGVFIGDDQYDQNTFLVKLDATGSTLGYGTYFGISAAKAIAIDEVGGVYLTGDTYDADFPTTPNAFDTTYNGGTHDAFVAKLNLNEPTAVGLAVLTAASTPYASNLAPLLIVAALLTVVVALLLRQRQIRNC